MWSELGYESFKAFVADPDIGLPDYRQSMALVQAYRELVIERDIPVARLGDVDASKVAVVLPALKRGEVTVEDALSDAQTLPRSDLRSQYRVANDGRQAGAGESVCRCCGQIKREDGDD